MNEKLRKIIEEADLIVNGYAFTKGDKVIRVLNIHNTDSACVLSIHGEVLETSMDDIEIAIVIDYFKKKSKYLENRIA